MARYFKLLLYPLALLYALVVRFRNHLYNIGFKKEIEFEVPVISIGNLVMGGTGKTPMSEFLIRKFSSHFNIAVLSRGYGRTSIGFKILTAQDTAKSVGDEPLQVFRKFGGKVTVAVGESRLLAIPQILIEKPEINLILLDDAYQHRKVKPLFNILLTNFDSPFYNDFIFPSGWLREPRRGARRASAIVVTKCPPDLNTETRQTMQANIARHSQAPVFFATLGYETPVPFGNSAHLQKEVVVISAVANNFQFGNYCKAQFQVHQHFAFADHHYYSNAELQAVVIRANELNASILTTEKDMVRILESDKNILNAPWFYVPVAHQLLEGEVTFCGMILDKIESQ